MRDVNRWALAAFVVVATSHLLPARQSGPPGVPVKVVITIEPKRGKSVPPLEAGDLKVMQEKDKRPVTSLKPLAPEAPTQLMLLIDDSSGSGFDTEINTLKQFVNALPPATEVAIAYMTHGMAEVTKAFTKDHPAAAEAIRIAQGAGGADVSPYDSLSDAVKKWPGSHADRKEIVMISSGIEELGGGFYSDNPYVTRGINDALKAGVIVYTIYNPSAGHAGHSYWRSNWGQNFLAELADQTGGEFYNNGFGSAVSFQPFLDQIAERQQHQYVLSFAARPAQKSGLQPIRISVWEKDASVAAPDKVYVRAGL